MLIDDLTNIGRQLITPLGFISILAVVTWVIATYFTQQARTRFHALRLAVCVWMVAWSFSLVILYLTPVDRDSLRLYIAIVLGWNVLIGWQMIRDARSKG